MRCRVPIRSTEIGFSKWGYAAAALVCAISVVPSFAQEVDWPYNGADVYNSGFANLDQINPANVSQLKPAWIFHTGVSDPNMSMEMTPLVVAGTMYVTTGDDDVFALNPTTGKQVWAYHPTDMAKTSTLAICCGNNNRGVAYGSGLIFVGRLDAKVVALNAKTGAVVWETVVDAGAPADGASITSAPQFIRASTGAVPEVLIGVQGGDNGARCHLDAYNPATGKLLWRFWTTEPSTWAGDSWLHGGAPVWSTPSYDPTLNMVYFTAGNAFPDFYGGGRAGTNLYSSSIIAVDATTGELQWFHQETHHDMWDQDSPQPTVLFSWNGVPALEHTSKTGYMWILDRASGEPLFPSQEVAVPLQPANAAFQHAWPTQPISSIEPLVPLQPIGLPPGFTAAALGAPPQPTPLAIQPFTTGGTEWPPAAYSSRTGFIYTHGRYNPGDIGVSSVPNNDPDADARCQPAAGPSGAGCGITAYASVPGVSYGFYGAVNTRTGKVAWKIPTLTMAPDSGMAVAGDLVFFGDSTGIFYAASAATGEILWVFDAETIPNAGGATASPAVYEINGVEYVVYGFGGNPQGSFTLGDAVVAFALPTATTAAAAKAK